MMSIYTVDRIPSIPRVSSKLPQQLKEQAIPTSQTLEATKRTTELLKLIELSYGDLVLR